MLLDGRILNNRMVRCTVALFCMTLLVVQCTTPSAHTATWNTPDAVKTVETFETVPAAAVVTEVSNDLGKLAANDPLEFLYRCRDHYYRNYRDYSVRFTKQELINGQLTQEEETAVLFREEPFSVNMKWVRNPKDAAHVTYIAGRWKDADGNDQAWCKPQGAILSLLVPKILQPIHGKRAERASRRTIDQFGFMNSLDLIIQYCDKAAAEGVLDLKYTGRGTVDGRPTYMFERLLPYTGEEIPYPDRLLVFHIDEEWLLPTAVFAYADDDMNALLGSYVLTDAEFNQGLDDADFQPEVLN